LRFGLVPCHHFQFTLPPPPRRVSFDTGTSACNFSSFLSRQISFSSVIRLLRFRLFFYSEWSHPHIGVSTFFFVVFMRVFVGFFSVFVVSAEQNCPFDPVIGGRVIPRVFSLFSPRRSAVLMVRLLVRLAPSCFNVGRSWVYRCIPPDVRGQEHFQLAFRGVFPTLPGLNGSLFPAATSPPPPRSLSPVCVFVCGDCFFSPYARGLGAAFTCSGAVCTRFLDESRRAPGNLRADFSVRPVPPYPSFDAGPFVARPL